MYQSQFLLFGGFLTDTSDMVALLEMLKSLDPNYFSIVGLHWVYMGPLQFQNVHFQPFFGETNQSPNANP